MHEDAPQKKQENPERDGVLELVAGLDYEIHVIQKEKEQNEALINSLTSELGDMDTKIKNYKTLPQDVENFIKLEKGKWAFIIDANKSLSPGQKKDTLFKINELIDYSTLRYLKNLQTETESRKDAPTNPRLPIIQKTIEAFENKSKVLGLMNERFQIENNLRQAIKRRDDLKYVEEEMAAKLVYAKQYLETL